MNLPAAKLEQKAKHTPGPWRLGDYPLRKFGHDWTIIKRATPHDSRWIAVICIDSADSDLDGRYTTTFDEQAANARLIAAAPEMLEALELLAATTRAYVAEGIEHVDAAIHVARQAIRKAKGEL